MNFLIGNGHTYASTYPLGRVWSEVEMTRRRRNTEVKSQAALDRALHQAVHGGKGSDKPFKQAMKDLG